MVIALRRVELFLIATSCTVAGMSAVLAIDAAEAGRNPVWSAVGCVCGFATAFVVARDAARRGVPPAA